MNKEEAMDVVLSADKEMASLDVLKGQVLVFVEPIRGISVTTASENAVAAGTLKTVKQMMKEIESRRVGATKPMNDRVSQINEYAKTIAAPLRDAETWIKASMQGFAIADESRRAEEQRRVLEERERAEAVARRVEQEALVEAKKKRDEEERALKAQQDAERKFLADKQREEQDRVVVFGMDPAQAKEQADLQRKLVEKEHQEERRRIEAEAEARIQAELARAERESIQRDLKAQEEQRRIEDSRPKNTRQVARYEITDPLEVPHEYWMIDDKKLAAVVRGGVREIPGVKIWVETQIVAR